MLKNAFKKYPPQNRTNVQIKGGGGGQRPFEQCSKKLHFFEMGASLRTCTPVPPQWLIRAGSRYYDLELFPECDAKDEITEVKYGLNISPLLAV